MHLDKVLDQHLVNITNPVVMTAISSALTLAIGLGLAIVIRGLVHAAAAFGAFHIVDPATSRIRRLVPYAWIVNQLSGLQDVIFGLKVLRREGSVGLLFLVVGTVLTAAKFGAPAGVIKWATWENGWCSTNSSTFGLSPAITSGFYRNATGDPVIAAHRNRNRYRRNVQGFINEDSFGGAKLADDIQIDVRDGCQDWVTKVPCSSITNKTVRVRFSDQGHALQASPYGTVSFHHDANCSFVDLPFERYNTTMFGDPSLPSFAYNVTFYGQELPDVPFTNVTFQWNAYQLTSSYIRVGAIEAYRLPRGRFVSYISDDAVVPQFRYLYYSWLPGFRVKGDRYKEDILYNFTEPASFGIYFHSESHKTVACRTSLSLVERTKEWGDIWINPDDSSDILYQWNASVAERGMPRAQADSLFNHYIQQFRASLNMRDMATAIFGDDLELANARLVDDIVVITPDLTLENHFRHMARRQQSVLRGQLVGVLLGKVYEDVDLENATLARFRDDGLLRVMCPGNALSVIRVLVILIPLLALAAIVTLLDNIPLSVLSNILRNRPGTVISRIAQRGLNIASVTFDAAFLRLGETVGGRRNGIEFVGSLDGHKAVLERVDDGVVSVEV
ncbi:hypothetical protein HDV00_008273, partial [Rhizophlyctis rosea]